MSITKKFIMGLCCLLMMNCCNNKEPEEKLIFVAETSPTYQPEVLSAKPQNNGGIIRGDDKEFINDINDPSLMAVTREFGNTVIKEKVFPHHSGSAKANIQPWSSWWYPKKDPQLFDDSSAQGAKDYNNLSTMTKFDLYKRFVNGDTNSAADFERANFNSHALDWEGLCDAWAMAAISVAEPQKEVTVAIGTKKKDQLTFNIFDLKGLLLKTFEAVDEQNFKYYGQKFTGLDKGWIYPDIFAEQFHRLLEVQLFERHNSFIMDLDQSTEIWNVPVFKANYTMAEIANKPNAVFVRTWVYFADSIKTGDKAFVGSKEVVREYDYVLEGERDKNGDLLIKFGYWVKGPSGLDSRLDHPDYIISPRENTPIIRKSWNPGIDIKLVDELIAKSY